MPKQALKIEVGGRQYALPPLSIAVLEQHEREYDLIVEACKVGRLPDRELVTAVRVLVHACISEVDADFTEEIAKKGIAVGDCQALVMALLTQSGFPKAGEGGAEGKAVSP